MLRSINNLIKTKKKQIANDMSLLSFNHLHAM